MRKLRLAGLAGAVLLLTATAATAEDEDDFDEDKLIDPIWTGPTIGLHTGYTEAADDVIEVQDVTVSGSPVDPTVGVSGAYQSTGKQYGLYLGADIQVENLVVGVMADVNYMEMEGTITIPNVNTVDQFSATSSVSWYATARPRIGLAISKVLLYGHAGLAYAGADVNIAIEDSSTGTPTFTQSDASEALFGYAVGGGLETRFSRFNSFRIEYQYADLGNAQITEAITGGGSSSAKPAFSFHSVRIGSGFHF